MPRFIDLIGKRFGKLLVLSNSGPHHKRRDTTWLCLCDCGKQHITTGRNLRTGDTKSCGCSTYENTSARFTTHGLSKTYEYSMLKSARSRAKKEGWDFNLEISDIIIPEFCPILKVKIGNVRDRSGDSYSPSLDRVDNSKGYIKGNVRVITQKANRMKQDCSIEQLETIIKYIKGEI